MEDWKKVDAERRRKDKEGIPWTFEEYDDWCDMFELKDVMNRKEYQEYLHKSQTKNDPKTRKEEKRATGQAL